MAPKRRSSAQKGPESKKAKPDETSVAKHLLETETYCEELGIDLENGGSDALFQWLCCSVIFSIGIAESSTFRAAKGLLTSGLNTPKSIKETDLREKIDAVNSEGNVQRGPSMSKRLEAAADLLLEKYNGDMYKLRDLAERDPEKEKSLLKDFKGLGDTAVSIFCREAQLVWEELFPFADERTLKSTAKAGLQGSSATELAKLVDNDRSKYVKLLAAAVKVDLRGGKANGNGKQAADDSGTAPSKGGKKSEAAEEAAKSEDTQPEGEQLGVDVEEVEDEEGDGEGGAEEVEVDEEAEEEDDDGKEE
jgi:hypothetical protein